MNDDYLTVNQCADLLHFDHQTIRRWIKEGKIEVFKVGKRMRIKRSTLDSLFSKSVLKDTSVENKVNSIAFESASEDLETDMY